MQKVLVIAEEAEHLDTVFASLKELGSGVERRPCVVSGLEFAVANRPDIVIIAEDFVGLDAVDFLDVRQDDPVLADIPTIVIHSSEQNKHQYFKLGCDDFILAPIDQTELHFRIRALQRRTRGTGISGDLAHISLVDLLQMLISSRSDGVMAVESGEKSGSLVFEAGQVVHGEWYDATQTDKRREGKAALLELLRVANNGGRFSYSAEKKENTKRTISERTDHILLSLANVIDEERI